MNLFKKMGISFIFRQFSFIFVHFQMNQSCVDVLTKSAKSICKFLHLYFKLFNNQHTTIPIVNLSVLHKKRVTISDYSCSSGNWTRTSDLRVMSPTSYLLLYLVIQLVIYCIFFSASNHCQNEPL